MYMRSRTQKKLQEIAKLTLELGYSRGKLFGYNSSRVTTKSRAGAISEILAYIDTMLESFTCLANPNLAAEAASCILSASGFIGKVVYETVMPTKSTDGVMIRFPSEHELYDTILRELYRQKEMKNIEAELRIYYAQYCDIIMNRKPAYDIVSIEDAEAQMDLCMRNLYNACANNIPPYGVGKVGKMIAFLCNECNWWTITRSDTNRSVIYIKNAHPCRDNNGGFAYAVNLMEII